MKKIKPYTNEMPFCCKDVVSAKLIMQNILLIV